jgi:diguanylate cyclase (GGDEF)-like protein
VIATTTDSGIAARVRGIRPGPPQHVMLLTAALAAVALTLFVVVVRSLPGPVTALTLPWWAWGAAFAISEVLVVHVQVEREAHSFSLTDLVLAAGLVLAVPRDLVLGLVVGSALALVLHRRQVGIKLAFNMASYGLGGSLAVLVVAVLAGPDAGTGPLVWLAVLAGVLASTLVGDLSIFSVISIMEGRAHLRELPRILGLSVPFALGAATVGLAAARTAVTDPMALALLSVPLLLVVVAYRAFVGAREQQDNLRLLHETTSLLHGADADAALGEFLTSVRKAFRAGLAEVLLVGDSSGPATVSRSSVDAEPVLMAHVEDGDDHLRLLRLATSGGGATRTGSGGGPLEDYAAARGLKDAMVAVLRTEDRVHGLLLVAGRLGDVSTFSRSDVALLETFGQHVATTLERGRLEETLRQVTDLKEQLRHQTLHDALTGLPNRVLFLDRARQAVEVAARTGDWPAVLYLDLDGFKPVNDEHGHDTGDMVLRTIAHRLRNSLRPGDTAARLGGDEFAVLLGGPLDTQGVDRVVERIRAQFEVPVDLGDGRPARIGASIGIALGAPGIEEADGLIRHADIAMYAAKRGGGGSVYYETGMGDPTSAREDAVAELTRAIGRGELVTVFQPLVNLRTGRATGAEALVRWNHPNGLRSPDGFIGLAEESGLIVEIGELVLRDACHQAARWARVDDTRPLTVTVNLSARQLADPGIVATVASALADADLDAKRLVLEITETVLMQDREAAAATLWALKGLGVRIAIDDFGTGYSSLAYLRRFPIDMLKIAREFVDGLGRDEHDDVITRAIVELAGTLGLLTVAEGIETHDQHTFVTALGCDLGQGYLFSRPVEAEEALLMLTGETDPPPTMPQRAGGPLLRVV